MAAGAAAIALAASVGIAPQAHAQDFGISLNGTYRVLSDGEWAKKGAAPGGGEVFYDQQTVVETWNVSTSCVSPIECTGTVTSDRGYTASIRLDDFWYVDHDIPNWLPCPNGTFAPGHQKFILWGFDPARNERIKTTEFLAGRNITKSPSGACGRNQPLVIEMPVRMERA
ncbi:Rv2253/PknI dimerization domain-containing protein [Mycobacterium deserti]